MKKDLCKKCNEMHKSEECNMEKNTMVTPAGSDGGNKPKEIKPKFPKAESQHIKSPAAPAAATHESAHMQKPPSVKNASYNQMKKAEYTVTPTSIREVMNMQEMKKSESTSIAATRGESELAKSEAETANRFAVVNDLKKSYDDSLWSGRSIKDQIALTKSEPTPTAKNSYAELAKASSAGKSSTMLGLQSSDSTPKTVKSPHEMKEGDVFQIDGDAHGRVVYANQERHGQGGWKDTKGNVTPNSDFYYHKSDAQGNLKNEYKGESAANHIRHSNMLTPSQKYEVVGHKPVDSTSATVEGKHYRFNRAGHEGVDNYMAQLDDRHKMFADHAPEHSKKKFDKQEDKNYHTENSKMVNDFFHHVSSGKNPKEFQAPKKKLAKSEVNAMMNLFKAESSKEKTGSKDCPDCGQIATAKPGHGHDESCKNYRPIKKSEEMQKGFKEKATAAVVGVAMAAAGASATHTGTKALQTSAKMQSESKNYMDKNPIKAPKSKKPALAKDADGDDMAMSEKKKTKK